MSPQTIASLITIAIVLHLLLGGCAYLILLERKVAAWTQDRIGPNRVNLSFGLDDIWNAIGLRWLFKYRHAGLGHALADGLKLFAKEEYTPPHVDRVLFVLAPMIAVIVPLIAWAVIPWGGHYLWNGEVLDIQAAPISIGVVYILAAGSLAVYGVVVGGYASNNKYSFLGGLRATAQMLSYEIPMGLAVLIVILMAGSTDTQRISDVQASTHPLFALPGSGASGGTWFIFYQPILAIIFFTCVLAECNRAPFDLAEAESELVGGYHTEYSSMKWALFFLGEYMHMITGCALFCVLFLGGWDAIPFVNEMPIVADSIWLVVVKFLIFLGKVTFLLFVMMWIRWTLPRFRFDQLMRLAWRSLIPVTLAILLLSGVIVYLRASPWWFLAANVGVFAVTMIVGPLIPQGPPVNRRVGLAGSRFSPPKPAEA